MTETTTPTDRLRYLPISYFSMVMGMAGFSIAWSRFEHNFQWLHGPSGVFLAASALVFAVLAGLYGYKTIRYPEEVAKEFNHPIKLSFFPTLSISLILFSIATWPLAADLSAWFWYVGASLHMVFTLVVVNLWISHTKFEIQHINPAWFIPVVGNILVPITGVYHGPLELSWFFFSVGLFFWLLLVTINFYRFLFHAPLPARMLPTLFILIAPPAVGFIAYTGLVGELDSFGRVLYYVAAFLMLMLLTQVRKFATLGFALTWWAYSFPSAAFTIATLVMWGQTGLVFFEYLSLFLLGLLCLLLAALTMFTLRAIRRGQICQPDD